MVQDIFPVRVVIACACVLMNTYMLWVGGWMGAFCSAFGAATQPQPLAVTDPLVLVATDNLLMPGSAVLL